MRLLVVLLLIILFLTVTTALAHEVDMVHITPTIFGPSGLIFTQSADTLEPGRIEAAVGYTYEKSNAPDLNINRLTGSATLGLPKRFELSAQLPYFFDSEGPGNEKNGLSDLNVSVKWRFIEQSEKYDLPSFGLSLTYYFPTAEKGFEMVDSWGVRALVVSSANVDITQPAGSYVVGFYADGGVFLRDTSKPEEEKHGILDLGLLFPLAMSRQLHLLLEGNATFKNDIPFEGDYLATTGGLRYITSSFSSTVAFQHRFMRDSAVDDVNQFIIQTGILF